MVTRLVVHKLFIFNILLVFLAAVAAQEAKSAPPFVYSADQLAQAREIAQRVGWSETMIEGQFPSPLSPDDQAWVKVLQAALLGEETRVQQAIETLTNLAAAWNPASIDNASLSTAFLTLRGYDCLTATPEWSSIDDPVKQPLREAIRSLTDRLLSAETNSIVAKTSYRLSTLLYAGLLSESTAPVNLYLKGSEEVPDIKSAIGADYTAEGLLYNEPMVSHLRLTADTLTAAAALKSVSPTEFESIQPWLNKTVRVMRDLSFPTAALPSILQRNIDQAGLIRLFERGYDLFEDPSVANLLSRLYQNTPRTAESLLYGGKLISLPTQTIQIPSSILPQTGAAVLRNASPDHPVSFIIDTGLSGQNPASALLSIERLEDVVSEEQGRSKTSDFNTVVVDRRDQPSAPNTNDQARNPLIVSAKTLQNGNVFVHAIASNQHTERAAYPGDDSTGFVPTYERILYLTDTLMLDLFRVRGGSIHDWIYHANSSLKHLSQVGWSSFAPADEEYEFIRNGSELHHTTLRGINGIDLISQRQGDRAGINERIWLIDPVETQLITGRIENRSFIVARRQLEPGEGDLFAVVHEFFNTDEKPEIKLMQLTIDPPPNRRNFQAVALAVIQNGVTDIFLSALDPSIEYSTNIETGKIVFQGKFGHVQLIGGTMKQIALIGGSTLRYDTHSVKFKYPLSTGYVRSVDPTRQSIEIDFKYRLPSSDTLQGHTLLAIANDPLPVMFQSIPIDSIGPLGPPQTMNLTFPSLLENPPVELCPPIKTGTQILFENVAELRKPWLNNNEYELYFSAPAEVMIEGATNKNRIFLMESNVLNKIRGEKEAGMIFFQIDPRESVNGKIRFMPMP